MKKLMIAAAIALTAVASQAATINWGSGAIMGVADDKGTKKSGQGAALLSNSSVAWYVFTDLTDSQYTAAQTAGTVYGWLSETPSGATKIDANPQGTKANGQMTNIETGKYVAGDKVNWASLIVYTDENSKIWYIENYGSDTFDGLGSQINKTNLAGKMAVGGTNITKWSTQAVPEPTSGLLLLLGVAGLALKRRRA